jgi:RNA polymerase sigma-70 factor (ECF subfamily)
MSGGSIQTRPSLLERLRDLKDNASWDEFYRTYRGLIYSVSRRAGLSGDESEEVVQETVISVAKKMPGFTYDPAKDSFKGWLLTVTRWRVRDQLDKRRGPGNQHLHEASDSADEQGTRTTAIERVPDPAGSRLDTIWDEEWEKALLRTALARIKRQVQPRQYEIYHLHVVVGQPVPEVAKALGVNGAQIYLAKHRVGKLIRKEVRKLKAGEL